MRTNKYKKEIMEVLEKNHLVSISDIHSSLKEADYSTVYRNVTNLLKEGILKQVVISKDNILYEKNDTKHSHDHFVCDDCGVIQEINFTKPKSSGFSIRDILVRGLCHLCK